MAKELIKSQCPVCGILFLKIYSYQKYCSPSCCLKINSNSHYQPKPKREVECAICGENFKTSRNTQKYCSVLCRTVATSKKVYTEHKCLSCGETFFPNRVNQKYCSTDCFQESYGRKTKIKKTCPVCGEKFKTTANGNQVYCSQTCRGKQEITPYPHIKVVGFEISDKIPSGSKGAISELLVAADLLAKEYHIFRSMSPHCFCDLIAIKGNLLKKIEVRRGFLTANNSISFARAKYDSEDTVYGIHIYESNSVIYLDRDNNYVDMS